MKIVSDNLAFITRDGQKLYSLLDLLLWLIKCDDKIFKEHVNERENHFYSWIKDAIGDSELAERIKNVKNKEEFIKILKREIFGQNKEIKKEKDSEVLIDFIKTYIKG